MLGNQKKYEIILLHQLTPIIKYFGNYIGLQFNHYIFIIEKTIIQTTLYICIVYDLGYWRKNLLNNFILKVCLFCAIKIVKNYDKSKYVYSGFRTAYDGAGSWSNANGFA